MQNTRLNLRQSATQPLLVALALALVGLLLRLFRLGQQSLWLDEGGTWIEVTRKGWGILIGELFSRDAAYPLYHLLLKGWVAIAGDSEWALRFPSALAGAAAIVALFFAAKQFSKLTPWFAGLAAGLMLISPYALWQSQDAKVYSLLICTVAALLWALFAALQRPTLQTWLALALVAGVSVFVHRLALLPLACALVLIAWHWPWPHWAWGRWLALLCALAFAIIAIVGLSTAAVDDPVGGSGHIQAGPLYGLWLTFVSFSLDRADIGGWLGLPLLVWLLPSLVLSVWGTFLLLRDAWQGQRLAQALAVMLFGPLLLYAIVLGFSQHYESRYTSIVFPMWMLLLAYPFGQIAAKPLLQRSLLGLLVLFGFVQLAVLFQPEHGQFSGAPVKEQWREGIEDIALRVQPDDLLIVQPYYVIPLWQYYAPRVTPDPLPQPAVFTNFGEGDCAEIFANSPIEMGQCYQRRYEKDFNEYALGKKRMLMLIAPEHARTVDPPKTMAQLAAEAAAANRPAPTEPDKYGWLGLRFQYASDQRTWPCGGNSYVGVEVMCASFPELYKQKRAPQPQTEYLAQFGGEIELRGYTLEPAGGALRAGGTLPITLYWHALSAVSQNYTMFLHLCQDCESPPAAQTDQPPLNGYEPAGHTTTWRINDPVHDERSIPLPANMPKGEYTLLLGVYPAGNPDPAARLSVVSEHPRQGSDRLILGTVTIE